MRLAPQIKAYTLSKSYPMRNGHIMNYHISPINKKRIGLAYKICFILVLINNAISCSGRKTGFDLPTFPGAVEIKEFSFKTGTIGKSYLVKLRYPNEINDVYKYYEQELTKIGWQSEGTKMPKWHSFVDVTQKKVNHFTAKWSHRDNKNEIYLFLRYESPKGRRNSQIEIEQSATIQLIY